MRRAAVLAAGVLLALVAAPPPVLADPEHGVTASCDWFWTGVPDSDAVVLRAVAQSHVTGHEGILTNYVECSVWSDSEAIQASGRNVTRDVVGVGGGVIRPDAFRMCVRAVAQWVTRIDAGGQATDTHRAEFSDPAGCLPPCHLQPRPAECAPAERSRS